jgi:hypothetical protein
MLRVTKYMSSGHKVLVDGGRTQFLTAFRGVDSNCDGAGWLAEPKLSAH